MLLCDRPLVTLDYEGNCTQARTIGGDYYDFLDMGSGEVGFVLADVAGKGIAAALLMASLRGSLQSQYSTGSKDIPQLLASVNRHFYKHTAKDRYATLFFGRYSDATRTLQYVNCGHNPPVLLRNGGAVERLAATATVLGLFLDWHCSVAEVRLETGDVLSIYTDGITETIGHCGEEFGEARLLDTLRKNRDLEASYILQNVQDAAKTIQVRGTRRRSDVGDRSCPIVLPNTFPSLASTVRCKSAGIGYPHLYAALIESGEHNFMRLHATKPLCPKGIDAG